MSGQQNEMRVSVDGTRLLLKINGEFSAAGVQELLARIGGARAEMQPPVPRSEQDNGGAQLACLVEPLSGFAADHPGQEGAQVLRFRSQRFGWLGWELAHNDARQLFEYLGLRLGLLKPGGGGRPQH